MRNNFINQFQLMLLVLFIGLVFSILFFLGAGKWERDKAAEEFKLRADNTLLNINHTINVQMEDIAILSTYFNSSNNVDFDEFNAFTYQLLEEENSIKAFAWIPRIPAIHRKKLELSARQWDENDPLVRKVYGNYNVTDLTSDGRIVQALEREEYYPVYFLRPVEGHETLAGLDLTSIDICRDIMARASKTNKPATSLRFIDVGYKTDKTDFFVLMPVFKYSYASAHQNEPRKIKAASAASSNIFSDGGGFDHKPSLYGFTLGIFNLSEILESSATRTESAGLDIAVIDESANKFLCIHWSNAKTATQQAIALSPNEWLSGLHRQTVVPLADQQIKVIVRASQNFIYRHRTWIPEGLLIICLLLTGTISIFLGINAIRTGRIKNLNIRLANEISEHKKAETSLHESEEKLKSILFNIVDLVWEVDDKGFFTYCSPSCLRILGWSREEIIGKTPFDFIDPEEVENISQVFLKISTDRAPIKDLENWNIRKDGRRICLLTNGMPVFDAQGNYRGYRGVDKDITDRKNMEERNQRVSDMQKILNLLMAFSLGDVPLESVMQYALDLLLSIPWLTIEPRGAVFFADDRRQEIKMAANSNLGSSRCQTCSAVPFGKCLCGKAVVSGKIQFASHNDARHEMFCDATDPHGHYCVPIVSKDKNLGVLCLYVAAGHSRNTDEEEFLTMVADVMASIIVRRNSEYRLQKITDCFLSFKNDPEANIGHLTDLAGELLNANFAVYQRTTDETRNVIAKWKLPPDFVPNARQAGTAMNDVSLRAADMPMTLTNLTATLFATNDSNIANCQIRAAMGQAVKCGGESIGVIFIGFTYGAKPAEDDLRVLGIISAAIGIQESQIKAEDERKAADALRLQAQKIESIGQLASGISHEINTPMQYVGDNTRFLKTSFVDLERLLVAYAATIDKVGRKYNDPDLTVELDKVRQSVDVEFLKDEIPLAIRQSLEGIEKMTKIVRSMRDMIHPESGDKIPSDVNRIIENAAIICWHEWKYIAEMEMHLDRNLPLIPCIPGELNQVILNLVVNAAHAIGDVVGDGSKGKGKISIFSSQQQDMVEIVIKDTGTGIPEEYRGKIFEQFFTTKPLGKGTGQGLPICRNIITKKHGGTLDFQTQTGQGTSFIIRLPLT